jgi:predicted O-linked N-acetylglucosamine transferase (SPINDLY family)
MSSYPENINESSPIRKFHFNLDSALSAKKDISDQITNLEERMEKIINHFAIDDMPVIRFILNMTHDKEVLKGLSKAIDRIADLVEVHDNLTSKFQIIQQAEKDPSWFAYTFGDFSSSFDDALTSKLLGDIENG